MRVPLLIVRACLRERKLRPPQRLTQKSDQGLRFRGRQIVHANAGASSALVSPVNAKVLLSNKFQLSLRQVIPCS